MLMTEFNLEDAQKVWFKEGIQKGIEKGIEKGREEALEKARQEKLEAARKMKTLGLSIEQISKILELSSDVIKKL